MLAHETRSKHRCGCDSTQEYTSSRSLAQPVYLRDAAYSLSKEIVLLRRASVCFFDKPEPY